MSGVNVRCHQCGHEWVIPGVLTAGEICVCRCGYRFPRYLGAKDYAMAHHDDYDPRAERAPSEP